MRAPQQPPAARSVQSSLCPRVEVATALSGYMLKPLSYFWPTWKYGVGVLRSSGMRLPLSDKWVEVGGLKKGVSAGGVAGEPSLSQSSPPLSQGSRGGRPLLPHEACAAMVSVWLLQEAQGEGGPVGRAGSQAGVCQPTMSGTNTLLCGPEDAQLCPPRPQIPRGEGQSFLGLLGPSSQC